jgi:hypothetical protein
MARKKTPGEGTGPTGTADWPKICRPRSLRACLKIPRGAVFAPKAGWRGATKKNIPGGSSTEEQRNQPAFGAKTLRTAGLLPVASVGSAVIPTSRDFGDWPVRLALPAAPPWPRPKSLAAAPLVIFRQAPSRRKSLNMRPSLLTQSGRSSGHPSNS